MICKQTLMCFEIQTNFVCPQLAMIKLLAHLLQTALLDETSKGAALSIAQCAINYISIFWT